MCTEVANVWQILIIILAGFIPLILMFLEPLY